MKKCTVYHSHNINLSELGLLEVQERQLASDKFAGTFSVGLRDTNLFANNNILVLNVVLNQKHLPAKVFKDELEKRLAAVILAKGLNESEALAAKERITLEILEQAFVKRSDHKVYITPKLMLIEASGSQCDTVYKFVKELVSEWSEFKEFTSKILGSTQDWFNAKYKAANSLLKVTCKVDDDNSLSFRGESIIDEHEEIVRGDIKQFTVTDDDCQYSVNSKLVFSGIKFFNEVESEEDSLDLERNDILTKIILRSWIPTEN